MLKYSLFENNMTSDPNDYLAVVQTIGTKTMEDVADLMISRGAAVTKAEALSIMEEYVLTAAQFLKDGYSVVTPMFSLTLFISGEFNSPDDLFDPARHAVNVRVKPGVRLREVTGAVSVEKIMAKRPVPVLQSFRDISTGKANEMLTPGGVGHIVGTLLWFDAADPRQGVFVTATDGKATKVEIVVNQRPAEVIFVIPTCLFAGEYSLSIRAIPRSAQDLREGFLSENLTVIAT